MATGPELATPEPYRAYVQDFTEADLESMHSLCFQNLAIELLDSW
jgi:hypothetical protein